LSTDQAYDTLPIIPSKTGLVASSPVDAVHFYPPPLNPTQFGLYAAVGDWQPDPLYRFLHGVEVHTVGNYGGENASGLWSGGICGKLVTIDVGTSTGGTFDLTVNGQTATGIAFHADKPTMAVALAGIGWPSDTAITTSPEAGTWTILFPTFVTVSVDGTNLTGGDHTATVSPETKSGVRDLDLDPFEPVTVWAYDQCDLMEPSREDVQQRVQQILRLEEQTQVERQTAARLLLDAADVSSPFQSATTLAAAVGYLEAQMAMTNTTGFFHVGAQWVAETQPNDLFIKSGTKFVSPMGHTWVIGGGYVDGLDSTIVATSQPFGWRTDPTVVTAIAQYDNLFVAVAERNVLIAYEHVITAVTLSA
jgi:hypothetical protein